jgi:hypothetical protein
VHQAVVNSRHGFDQLLAGGGGSFLQVGRNIACSYSEPLLSSFQIKPSS